jgi:hypothetical protein
MKMEILPEARQELFGAEGQLLGKGKQSLLFVSSKDYGLLDIPSEVYTAFMKYL